MTVCVGEHSGAGSRPQSRAYEHGLAQHLKRLGENGLPWWSGADRHLLEVTFRITAGDAGVKVRPRGTFNLLNGGRLAREDVRALVASVSTRLHRSDPPTVRGKSGRA